jgi:RNA polymerase sigma-70 factor, ECF subfamily
MWFHAKPKVPGAEEVMRDLHELEDQALVRQCLLGERAAWDSFYRQYLPMVRHVAQRHTNFRGDDIQDTVHEVFLALYDALKDYDPSYKLSHFVWMVAKRVCVDQYRRSTALKRTGQKVAVDHHDGSVDGEMMLAVPLDPADDLLAGAQLMELVRKAFRDLGERCREILRLRYFEELPYKEMATILDTDKKTLAVQAGRCIDELRAVYECREREGLR